MRSAESGMPQEPVRPVPTSGRLGILAVGVGARSTTLWGGGMAVRRGLAKPVGALTQMGRVLGPPGRPEPVLVREAVPLAALDDLVFGAWDILPDDAFAAAEKARVLERDLLRQLRAELGSIRPWRGIFDPRFVRRIDATHALPPRGHLASVAQIEKDIQSFRESTGASRL